MANDFEVVAEPTVGETDMADGCAFIPDAMLWNEGGGVGACDALTAALEHTMRQRQLWGRR